MRICPRPKAVPPCCIGRGHAKAAPEEGSPKDRRPCPRCRGKAAAAPAPKVDRSPDYPEGTEMVTTTVREALRDAMAEEMRSDDDAVFVMGEEVAEYQGAYKITQGCWTNSAPVA